MSYTLSAAFIKAMSRSTVQPVVHCSIALSGTTMDFHNSTEALDASVTGDALLSEITSIAQSVDPVTRKVQHGEMTLNLFDDGKIRALAGSKKFRGKVATIKLGDASLALSDFVSIFRGPIGSVLPVPGGISIKVQAFTHQFKGVKTFRTYVDEHPFAALSQMLQDCGVDSGDIDTASFTPSNHTDISHYNYSSFVFYNVDDGTIPPALSGTVGADDAQFMGVNRASQEIDVEAFADEAMRLTRSTLLTDPGTGDIKIGRYNASEAVTKHFTTNEYRDFSQEDGGLQIVSEVKTAFGKISSENALIQLDSTAESAFGASDFSHTVNYLSGSTVHIANAFNGSSTAFLGFASDGGICGTRDILEPSQPADAKLSAARPYFGLYRTEILKSTTAFTDTNLGVSYQLRDHDGELTGSVAKSVTGLTTTLVSRPFAGTEAGGVEASAAGVKTVVDATIAFDYGVYVLDRLSNSCPRVVLSTGLEHLNVEIADLVSLDSDLFLSTALGLDGLDSSTKFEVTKREVTPIGDSIGIVFELTYATTSSAPSVTVTSKTPVAASTSLGRVPKSQFIAARTGGDNGAVIDNQTSTLQVTATSGLEISVAAGAVSAAGVRVETDAAQALTVTASKDSYIGINPMTSGYYVQEVNTDAAEPSLAPAEIRLAKVVAGGSSVSSVTDLRNYGQVSVEQLDKTAFAPGKDLIWNAGFTTYPNNGAAPPGWSVTTSTPGTDFIKDEAVVYDGRYAVKTLGTSTVVRLISEKIPIDKNRVYRASAFYRQAAAMNMKLFVYWWKADRTAASTASTSVYNANLTSTGAWQNITGVVAPPSDAVYASLDLNSANSGVSYFNNATLEVEPFSFSAKRTSSSFTSGSTGDPVIFNSEIHDHGGNYDTSSGQFTVPVSSTYTLSTNLSLAAASARTVSVAIVASSSGTLASAFLNQALNSSSTNDDQVVSLTVASADLVKGETVEVKLYWDVNAPPVDADYSFFSGREIT
jgi:hypothetical protein